MATLAATALRAPDASVMFAGSRAFPGLRGTLGLDGQPSPLGQSLCADVVGSDDKLIIGDIRLDRRISNRNLPAAASMMAWAGVPVHDQEGHVAGVLWVADQVPRQWGASDVAVLETLAEVTSSEPGDLLGVLARPELHDSQRLLRPGDSLIMFSDGVTEARGGPARDLYGDERLRRLVARLGDLSAPPRRTPSSSPRWRSAAGAAVTIPLSS